VSPFAVMTIPSAQQGLVGAFQESTWRVSFGFPSGVTRRYVVVCRGIHLPCFLPYFDSGEVYVWMYMLQRWKVEG